MARSRFGGQFAALKPERGVMSVMMVLTAVCLIINVGGGAVAEVARHLVMTPRTALGWEPWQLVTNAFVEPDFIDLLLTFVMLIFFGNPLEQKLGARAFWKIFVGGVIGGSLLAAIVGRLGGGALANVPLLGAQPAMTALLVAFGALWAGQQVRAYGVAQMSATTMTWIFVGINVLVCCKMMRADWHVGLINLCAVAGAAFAGWLLTRRGGLDLGGSLDKMRMWRLKRRYRVLTGGRDTRADKRWLN
jgi:membrane associated rhomboid family serine protease